MTAALMVAEWTGVPVVPQHGLLLAAVKTPHTAIRHEARRRVREVLAGMLASHLECPEADVRLMTSPGGPVRLDRPGSRIALSVSHEPGLSVAVAHLGGPVGIDLMSVSLRPEWAAEIPTLARDYLGPEVAAGLDALPAGERIVTFARHWTELEARLKCLGVQLQEWSADLQRELNACRSLRLQVPDGFIGTVAVPA